jgi:hypothetical protein
MSEFLSSSPGFNSGDLFAWYCRLGREGLGSSSGVLAFFSPGLAYSFGLRLAAGSSSGSVLALLFLPVLVGELCRSLGYGDLLLDLLFLG